MGKQFRFRCPVHGFIEVDEWEKDIINQPAFQRLRRIRQLAWTDYIYPGAMHTRFEHSLGVMHVATRLFDAVCDRSEEVLRSELSYDPNGRPRLRKLIRLAALLHDVGHGPFSHASEELFPVDEVSGKRFEHDTDYSAAIIRQKFAHVIETSEHNTNYGIRADDIAAMIEGSTKARSPVFWRELISGQMDADRMDYLLRDSLHAGVQYGRFDLERLIQTVVAIPQGNGQSPRLGVTEGGLHAAESLIMARYLMFTQVYFHRTRVAYDHHLFLAMKKLLPNGVFPPPNMIGEYLKWDDWRVLGLLAAGKAGEHGKRILGRDHYREVYHTPEIPRDSDLTKLQQAKDLLGTLCVHEQSAGKVWYKMNNDDIQVQSDIPSKSISPLSRHSNVVRGIKSSRQVLLYAKPEKADTARQRLEALK